MKVLLVEDNALNRDMLTRRLQRQGYTVLTAEDGEKALLMSRQQNPDLVLMDLSLPKLDGWAATAKLKANPETRHIPVIALTAHAIAGERDKALDAGCDDYDTKPIDFDRLLAKINQLTPPGEKGSA